VGSIARPPVSPVILSSAQRLVYEDRVQVPRLYVQWPTVGEKSDDRFALDVLGSILAGRRTARLTKALVYDQQVDVTHVGELQTELLHDFFEGFVNHLGANLHAKVLYGRSSHHKIEAIFKCFARAMRYACSTDERLKDQLPSTKGLL